MHTPPTDNDAALLARVAQQADHAAFEQLYRRFAPLVFAFARQRVGDARDAEEVVSDTLYQVWKSAPQFKGHSTVKTWLLGIAKYKALDLMRAKGWQTIEELDDAVLDIPDESPGLYEQLCEKQNAQVLQDCIALLPDVQQESFHFAVFEGMSLNAIAAIQAVPQNTVATRIHHAKRKIKDCVSKALGLASAPTITDAA
jgi:RNA polymerase sigma-70 factor, ECF subfamily